jgi:glycosyltransferase involved in cell wall biosynthesis
MEGILRQRTNFPFEVVIGDDCSQDNTRAILREHERRYPDRIRLFFPERNLGLQGNMMFSRVLAQLRGEYVAWLDGDDYWTDDDKLQRQVDFLDDNPSCSMCFHDADNSYPDGSTAPFYEYDPGQDRYSLQDIVIENFVPFSSVVHRNIIKSLPPLFFEILAADWVVHVLLAQRGLLGRLNGTWAVRRVHPAGVISMKPRAFKLALNVMWVQRIEASFRHGYSREVQKRVAYLYRELALDAESNGRKWRAAWYAAKSLAHGRRDDGDRQELLRLALGSRIAGLLKSSAHQSAGA